MSILNAWVGRERALVGVDSEASALARDGVDSGYGQCSKLVPLVHLNAVLAIRGNEPFLAQLVCGILVVRLSSFDGLVAAMPGVLPKIFDQCVKIADQCPQFPIFDGQTVVLVGWSKNRNRMLGFEYEQDDRGKGFTAEELKPSYSAPWDPLLPPYPDFSNRIAMAEYAKLQTRLLHEKAPGVAAGGRFIVADLRHGSVRIDTACDLPQREGN